MTINIRLGVHVSYAEHPLKRLVDAGCVVTLNSDVPVLFQTTLTDEYLHAVGDCGLNLSGWPSLKNSSNCWVQRPLVTPSIIEYF